MSTNGGLQFLPQEHRFHLAGLPGTSGLLSLSIVFLIVAIGAYVALTYYAKTTESEIAAIDGKLELIQKSRDKSIEDSLTDFSQQLSTVRGLLASHVAWSNIILDMQHSIDSKVRLASLEVETSQKRISLRGFSDSYATVAKQIASLYHNAVVKDLTLSRVQSVNKGGVEFTMQIIINPEGLVMK